MRVKDYRELHIYQLAFESAMRIFHLTKAFPAEEKFALSDQIRRSSRSICSNIAEAWRKRRWCKWCKWGQIFKIDIYSFTRRLPVNRGQGKIFLCLPRSREEAYITVCIPTQERGNEGQKVSSQAVQGVGAASAAKASRINSLLHVVPALTNPMFPGNSWNPPWPSGCQEHENGVYALAFYCIFSKIRGNSTNPYP